ncbi:PaaI family thioesterase [Janibacter anophelis]|uniref:PaaI family thioesterase n=1 Tax=Janibacter anophelis TaxID=319054 RepID=UPI003F810021
MGSPPHESNLCGGCRSSGRCRLGLRTWEISDEEVVVRGVCPATWTGGPSIAHGGWTAAAFDDVVGRTVRATGVRSVTAHLGVDFVLPVPVENELVIRARITGAEGRRRFVEAVLELAGTGEVLARADATMVVVDDRHYDRHRARMGERAAGERGDAPHAR